MRNNFDREFRSDGEIEEELDAILESIGEDLIEDEAKTTIANPHRIEQMQFSYAVLKYLIRNTSATISYELYKPFKTMGSITVEGKLLDFDKPEWFARAAEFANSTDIYPLSADRVRIEFTFHGLTVPMGGGEKA